jgi:hypothetical protein
MALGGRGHRLGAGVDEPDRLAGHPRRHREKRLDRYVELAAEAAAAGRRADAHLGWLDAEHACGLLAVHVGGLGAAGHLHPVAGRHGPAGLRLDIGVLHEGGLEPALGHRGGARACRIGVAAFEVALRQHVVRLGGVDRRGAGRARGRDAGD